MIDLNYLIFDRLFDLVEHNRNLNINILFLRYLQLGVIASDVKDVQITVAGTIHPAEAIVDWVVKDTVSGAVPVTLVDSLAT